MAGLLCLENISGRYVCFLSCRNDAGFEETPRVPDQASEEGTKEAGKETRGPRGGEGVAGGKLIPPSSPPPHPRKNRVALN